MSSAEVPVMALDRRRVPVPLVKRDALVGLEKRRVADHVSEHHRGEPAIEVLLHRPSASG